MNAPDSPLVRRSGEGEDGGYAIPTDTRTTDPPPLPTDDEGRLAAESSRQLAAALARAAAGSARLAIGDELVALPPTVRCTDCPAPGTARTHQESALGS